MPGVLLLSATILFLAFCVGYAIRRGSICAVLATRALILDRKSSRFRAFGVAAAGSGAVIVPLHWMLPDYATLSAGYPITLTVLIAGAVFGIGACINGACALGTLAHLTGGDLRYLATVIGMVAGAVAIPVSDMIATEVTGLRPSVVEGPSVGAILYALGLFGVLCAALYRRVPRWVRALRDPVAMRMGPYRSMLVVGICGGLLFALAGNWTYMSVLSNRAAMLVDPTVLPDGWPALLCAAAVVDGGISAAVRSGLFMWQRPRAIGVARGLVGGALMGGAAAVIPGGNGTMLIHSVPSLAPHALAAYAMMTATLCIVYVGMRLSGRGG